MRAMPIKLDSIIVHQKEFLTSSNVTMEPYLVLIKDLHGEPNNKLCLLAKLDYKLTFSRIWILEQETCTKTTKHPPFSLAEEREIGWIMKSKLTVVNFGDSFQLIHIAEDSERTC